MIGLAPQGSPSVEAVRNQPGDPMKLQDTCMLCKQHLLFVVHLSTYNSYSASGEGSGTGYTVSDLF
jgi:hypothetical protein